MNYNNNLGLGLTFLLVSLGLVTMHHCHGTLAGVRLRLLEAVPGFAGGDVRFRLLLEHSSNVARPALEIGLAQEGAGQRHGRPAAPGLERSDAGPARAAPRPRRARALHRLDQPSVRPVPRLGRRASGVFRDRLAQARGARAARRRSPRRTPAARSRAPAAKKTSPACGRSRPATRCGASHGRPMRAARACTPSSTPAPTSSRTSSISTACAGLAAESRLEQLCRWVLDAHERGEAFALRLPGTSIETNVGPGAPRTLPERAGAVRGAGDARA